jgi:tryptophan-rich sensory protein
MRQPPPAAPLAAAALLGVLSLTIWQFAQVDPLAAQLMLPYAAFSVFAAALTYEIRTRNGDKVE